MQIRPYIGADKPAVILYPSRTVVTFDDLEARANRLAHRFRKAGLREGDSVAILMENNEHIHAVMWAARRSGLYYVPINTHLTAAEAAYIIDNSNAKGIIGSAAPVALTALRGYWPLWNLELTSWVGTTVTVSLTPIFSRCSRATFSSRCFGSV